METVVDVVPAHVGTPSRLGVSGNFSAGVVEVKVERASDLDGALNEAATEALKAAIEHKVGILMTRVDVGRYIVQAHPEVPFGLTRQCYI